MGIYSYITNRTITNEAGEAAGKIRVLVKNGSADAETDYVCPECKKSEHTVLPWKKPFSVKCSGCGHTIKVLSIKSEMKKEKKKAKETQK
jgi:ribosomal protein L37AE/L43A